jgi:ketosteroid isomerase-like protein
MFHLMARTRQLVTEFIESLERRDWEAWSSLLHRDVVYEIPQTRERIRGRDQYLRFNQEFPGDWHLTLRVAIADEERGVAWFVWEVDDEGPADAMAFFTFSDDLITSVTDFWPEPYEPPSGREHLVERW